MQCYWKMLQIKWRTELIISRRWVYWLMGVIYREAQLTQGCQTNTVPRGTAEVVMKGRIEVGGYRGRPRQLIEDVNCGTYEMMKRKVQQRSEWMATANDSPD